MLLYAVARSRLGRRGVYVGLGVILGIMGVTTGLAESGAMARDTMPSPAMGLFFISNLSAVALALSPVGRHLAAAVTPAFWLLLQGFRLPLEVVLHLWQQAGSIPIQMSWSGQNLDVITGALSLGLGLWWGRNPRARWAGWLGHAVGLGLLFNVGRIALLSVPSPLQSFEAPLLLPFHAPYLWIVPFAVSSALFAHIVGLRALARTP